MATEFEIGMCGETARELERVRREVLVAKQELRERFELYFRVLRDKHLEMEAQLDEVVHVAETQVMDTQTQLNQLKVTKAEVSHNLVHNKSNKTLVKVSRELEEEIKELEAIVYQVPSVWLEWSDEWLEGGMRELCRVCEGVSYVHRQTPVCTGVSGGYGLSDIINPQGLVTDRDNGEVFVCDFSANIIQVYDKDGNYQRSFKLEGFFPESITITPHQLFVSCIRIPYSILKLDKLSGNITGNVKLGNSTSCITADTDTLYVGMRFTNQIFHLSLEDMSTMKMTSLNSPYIHQATKLYDLKVTPSLFVVLFSSSNNPIQTFSKEGNFVRTIASEEQLKEASFLCLDRQFNILVSDFTAHDIKVYSSEGHLIATIGHEGTEPGEFCNPMGIDVDKDGRIVVIDNKDTHTLQLF